MKSNSTFVKNLKYLGFEQDNESLYLCSDIDKVKPEIRFHLEIANEIEATAVFFKKEIGYKVLAFSVLAGSFLEFVYLLCVSVLKKILKLSKPNFFSPNIIIFVSYCNDIVSLQYDTKPIF